VLVGCKKRREVINIEVENRYFCLMSLALIVAALILGKCMK